MDCPNCGEAAPDDAKWCEACGQDLNQEPLPACVSCGEREVADEGYCLSCGHKQPAERDHMEFEAGSVVAVTDRGKRHRHNEDAVAIGMSEDGAAVLVVCDGVSSTPGSAAASLRAAAAARDLLVAGLNPAPAPANTADAGAKTADSVAAETSDHEETATETVSSDSVEDSSDAGTEEPVEKPDAGRPAAAGLAGEGLAGEGLAAEDSAADEDPDDAADTTPEDESDGEGLTSDAEGVESTELDLPTLLSRAVEAAQTEAAATVVGADEAVDVNSPHSDGGPPSSTFVAVVARPQPDGVDLATAWVGDSRAYWVGDEPQRLSGEDHELEGSLVRWLGADTLDATPDMAFTTVTGTGHVVVCSDGMWRYAKEPGELDDLVRRLTDGGNHGLALAAAMVDFANDGGGHDNISIALWGNGPDPESENH